MKNAKQLLDEVLSHRTPHSSDSLRKMSSQLRGAAGTLLATIPLVNITTEVFHVFTAAADMLEETADAIDNGQYWG